MNGIFSLVFRGLADWGMAVLVLKDGIVCGADANGVQVDGQYHVADEFVSLDLTIVVPPGVSLVQGTPAQPSPYSFPIKAQIPKRTIGTSEPTLVQTPQGPLNVLVRKLRDLSV